MTKTDEPGCVSGAGVSPSDPGATGDGQEWRGADDAVGVVGDDLVDAVEDLVSNVQVEGEPG